MARIIRTYKETLPSVRFVGKCYTSEDRVNGSFAHKWEEWFTNGWFEVLEKLPQLENVENGYLGWMRSDLQNSFEYWIGMFLPVNTQVPEGFDYIDRGKRYCSLLD